MYEYQAKVVKIIDGDTLDIQLDVGFYITVQMRLRLLGIDTPEMRGPTAAAGLAAKQFVEAQLPSGHNVIVRTYKIESFGRYIAKLTYLPGQPDADSDAIRAGGVDLSQTLLDAGHAEIYRDLMPTYDDEDVWDDLAD